MEGNRLNEIWRRQAIHAVTSEASLTSLIMKLIFSFCWVSCRIGWRRVTLIRRDGRQPCHELCFLDGLMFLGRVALCEPVSFVLCAFKWNIVKAILKLHSSERFGFWLDTNWWNDMVDDGEAVEDYREGGWDGSIFCRHALVTLGRGFLKNGMG